MRVRVLIVVMALPLLLWAVLPIGSEGATATSAAKLDSLNQRIDNARSKIGRKKGTERVLSSEIRSYSRRIDRLQGKIGVLQGRQDTIEVDLNAKRAELERLRKDLRKQKARKIRLRERLQRGRKLLRNRLVEIYKADRPDLVTIIFNSDGFADLLERGEFIKRISDQDRNIIRIVRTARKDAVANSKRLARLEARQAEVTNVVLRRRNEVSSVRMQLLGTRIGYDRTKQGKANALQKVRNDRQHLESHVEELEAASAKIQKQLGRIPSSGIKRGSGKWIYPASGPVTGVFGEARPGHMHAGIDFAIPEGTPLRAVDNGKVVLQQGTGASGGYGNYTCIDHGGGLSSCYAHQSRFVAGMGANVSQGQIIGYSGNTGHSTGPHLHFEARVNGAPVNPMNYL